jgi:hypothetical protein
MMNLRSLLLACAIGAAALGAALPAAAQVYGGVYVQTGPPAPIYETVPASPGSGYYWVGGYYRWNGYRYVWVPGHYAGRPYAGAVWRPGHWVQGPNGWYWRAGHWAHQYY